MTAHILTPISFFVAIHKDAPLPPPCDNFFALGVGGYQSTAYPFSFSDDIGESIWHKNKHYSELTGWYWIWKNLRDVDVLGLCHYRRYFLLDNKRFLFLKKRRRYFHPTPDCFNYITAPERTAFVEKALSKCDVIIPQRIPLDASLSQNYANCHMREDWDLFIQGIETLYPQYSTEISWFDKTSYIHPYNMMIAPREFFDRYMSTLFPLLFWMEEKRPFRSDPYQCRVPAFLAERFFTFYLHVTRARAVEIPIAILEAAAY
jgi:hypothetical protein